MARPKEMKDVTLAYASDAAFSLTIRYSNAIGGGLTNTATAAFPSTSGAQASRTVPLDASAPLNFIQAEFEIDPTGVVKLFDGECSIRPIGTYINGVTGEVWRTQPTDFGF